MLCGMAPIWKIWNKKTKTLYEQCGCLVCGSCWTINLLINVSQCFFSWLRITKTQMTKDSISRSGYLLGIPKMGSFSVLIGIAIVLFMSHCWTLIWCCNFSTYYSLQLYCLVQQWENKPVSNYAQNGVQHVSLGTDEQPNLQSLDRLFVILCFFAKHCQWGGTNWGHLSYIRPTDILQTIA